MKRVIKFRVWDSELKIWIWNIGMKKNNVLTNGSEHGRFHILQFTGLKDKNGVEIFEGDIVQHDSWNYPFEIIFHQEKSRFVCRMTSGMTQYIDNELMVVVGNIYGTLVR